MKDKVEKRNVDLGKDPIKGLLLKLAIPAIASQIVNVLYNIVDRVFIGHIPKVGNLALTGVGVGFPIVILISSFAALFSYGAATRSSIYLGRKDKEMAEKILGNSLTSLLIASLFLSIFVIIFKEKLLYIFGASPNTISYGLEYISIYALGTIFVHITLGMNVFIAVQGFSTIAMRTVIIGALSNIILDPIFIYVFAMGVRGAALATIISQALSAIHALKFLTGSRTTIRIRKSCMKIEKKILLPALALGVAPFIMQSTESVLMLAFNYNLLKFGGDLAVGTMTITSSLMQFALLPVDGITLGGQAILSYNFGANDFGRVKEAFKIQTIACVGFTSILWALLMIFPSFFAKIFSSNVELIANTSWAIRVFFVSIFLFGLQLSCQQSFIAFSDARTSTFLAIFRKMIVLIPLIFILPRFFDDKVFAVFLSEPIADTIAVLTTVSMFRMKFKKIEKFMKLDRNSKAQLY
ncbi:MATE family efflux transporter [Anaerococcus tetradius]|uniref:Multidrug export protein MepA n=1 Tax=Anaerococcus tetradius TaxID=33036 RepID=A0A133KE54_9FIRM|nr:MATE family efflux transporter [Anaerococcus tetradius]KWZ77744.1 MATE efflux family protein [Anaerococcus tetradius]